MHVSTWRAFYFICDWFGCKLWCHQIRMRPEIVSKLLHNTIWSCCAQWAVWLESEHTSFSQSSSIQTCFFAPESIGTYECVPIPYLSQRWTNDRKIDQTKFNQWVWLWKVTSSSELHAPGRISCHMRNLKNNRGKQGNCKSGNYFVFWARDFLTTWRNPIL